MNKLTISFRKIKEEFTGVWTLLNETSRYIKQAKLFNEYEPMFKRWRSLLQKRYTNTDTYKSIKNEIISFRRELRNEGHDLRLGNYDLHMLGFKSDDAPRYGFRRAIIYLSEKEVLFKTGEENHNELISAMEHSFGKERISNYEFIHSIWFRWKHNLLEIAGADSETQEQYQNLEYIVEGNKLFLLKYLKEMK